MVGTVNFFDGFVLASRIQIHLKKSMGSLAFAMRVTVIRQTPFIGYQSQEGRWLSRDTPLYILSGFVRTMSDNVAKHMKGFERKLPSRRRHLSLARADIVRHKSGISLSSPGLTTSD